MRSSSLTGRRTAARESFANASETIGPISKGLSLFAVTRGQWSMIDAVLHCLDQVGRSKVTLWTWTVAEYEIEVLARLRIDERLSGGTLIVDSGARNKNAGILAAWKTRFGDDSVRYVVNHAKIATVESESGYRLLLRGSMNLNFNPRFEQFDLTEGGPDFDLVREIESELPILRDDSTNADAYAASKLDNALSAEQFSLFRKVPTWKPSPR